MEYQELLDLVMLYAFSYEAGAGLFAIALSYVGVKVLRLANALHSLQAESVLLRKDFLRLLKTVHVGISEGQKSPPPEELVAVWRKKYNELGPNTTKGKLYKEKLQEHELL